MQIYLDMCCLQRPMDNQAHFRVHIETEAIFGILAWCETLVISPLELIEIIQL